MEFVHTTRPFIIEGPNIRYISASISNDEGVICNIVSYTDDIEIYRGYVKANKVKFQIIMIFTFSSNTKYVKRESIPFIEN